MASDTQSPDEAAIRARHFEIVGSLCFADDQDWPCDYEQERLAHEQTRRELAVEAEQNSRHWKQLCEEQTSRLEAEARAEAAEAERDQWRARAERYAVVLQQIRRWFGIFPDVRLRGEVISYGAAYGSNGERDYVRNLAADALEIPRLAWHPSASSLVERLTDTAATPPSQQEPPSFTFENSFGGSPTSLLPARIEPRPQPGAEHAGGQDG